MRLTEDFIEEEGLTEEHDAYFGGHNLFWLGFNDSPGGMDEGSDNEDPEAKAVEEARNLRQEAAGSQRLMDAVRGMVDSRTQHQEILLELERARMRAEDRRM